MSKSLEELEALAAEGKNKVPVRDNKPNLIKPNFSTDQKCRHGVYNCNLPHDEAYHPTDSSFWWTGVMVFIVAGGYLWLLHLLRS